MPVSLGGSTCDKPEDFGFMYTHSFLDPDGHGWGLVHMSATPAQHRIDPCDIRRLHR